MTWARSVMLVGALSGLAACSDGNDSDGRDARADPRSSSTPVSSSAPAPATAAAQYVLLSEPGWELKEAYHYAAGAGRLGATEPHLQWYEEYDGPRTDNPDGSYTIPGVRVSGHTVGLDDHDASLVGFELRPAEVAGRRALVGAGAGQRPAVVLVELAADYSVLVLTYDSIVDVPDLAGRLRPASEAEWVAAGGKILDCVPYEDGCAVEDE